MLSKNVKNIQRIRQNAFLVKDLLHFQIKIH